MALMAFPFSSAAPHIFMQISQLSRIYVQRAEQEKNERGRLDNIMVLFMTKSTLGHAARI